MDDSATSMWTTQLAMTTGRPSNGQWTTPVDRDPHDWANQLLPWNESTVVSSSGHNWPLTTLAPGLLATSPPLSANTSMPLVPVSDGSASIYVIIVSFILGVLTLMTIIGNVFVIGAIIMERNLQTTANYLVLSLAVADLMVACLVMPLGAASEIAQKWSMGTFLCDIWTMADVLCCTASILHLLAIALVMRCLALS